MRDGVNKQDINTNLSQSQVRTPRKRSKVVKEYKEPDTNVKYRIVEEWESEDAFFDYVIEKFR